jgi:hypothetical protein
MIAYTPSGLSGTFDRWTGVPIGQPSTPSSVRTGVADAAHFGIEVENNLLACIKGSVASPFYGRAYACASGIATGNPLYLSDAVTVALAEASGSGTSKVIGFCRDKTADGTGCYISHYWAATGGTFTTGSPVYLNDTGGLSLTAGTFRHALGVGISTTGAILYAGPVEATLRAARLETMALQASVSGNAESGNYRAVTVKTLDAGSAQTGARLMVEAWLADTGYGWECSSAPTGFVVASGQTGDTPTAGKRVRGTTLADGTITFHVQTDAVKTYVFHASVFGRVYSLDLAFA